ncbi:hypothetical protein JCM15765_19520 [Paradesulfitobacterium aromaticivorans]
MIGVNIPYVTGIMMFSLCFTCTRRLIWCSAIHAFSLSSSTGIAVLLTWQKRICGIRNAKAVIIAPTDQITTIQLKDSTDETGNFEITELIYNSVKELDGAVIDRSAIALVCPIYALTWFISV